MAINDEERKKRLAALGAKVEMPTPEGEAKMSAVILQLADPLMTSARSSWTTRWKSAVVA